MQWKLDPYTFISKQKHTEIRILNTLVLKSRKKNWLFFVISRNMMSFLVGCIRVVHKKHFPSPIWSNKLVQKFVLLFITEHMLVQSSLAFCWLLESFLATPTTSSDPCPPVQSIEPPNHWPNCFVLVQFTVAYFGADCGFKWLTNFQQRPVKYTFLLSIKFQQIWCT